MRGGSFINDADNARVSNRNGIDPSDRNDDIGFRPSKASSQPDAACSRTAALCTRMPKLDVPRSQLREPNR